MARLFNGSSEYVDCGSGLSLDPPTAMSGAMWVYQAGQPGGSPQYSMASDVSGQRVFTFGTDNHAGTYSLDFGLFNWTGNLGGATPLAVNTWYHIGFTNRVNKTVLYLNGVADASNADSHAIPQVSAPKFRLGSRAFVSFETWWFGLIAEAGFWGAELTAAEMSALYAGRSVASIRPQSLAGYWPLDGGAPGFARDLSVYRNHGTLHGTLLRPNPPRIATGPNAAIRPAFFSQPGAGGATTLTAATGTFTETGIAATFQIQDPEAVGAFAETGIAATTQINLVASSGAFTETGQAVTFLQATLLIAAAGSFAETGIAALFEQFLASAAGSFVETGFSAQLGAPAFFIVAGGGTYVFTGFAAIELLSSGWRVWYGPGTQWSSATKPASNWTLEPPVVPWSRG